MDMLLFSQKIVLDLFYFFVILWVVIEFVHKARKGRGAATNRPGRFEKLARIPMEDGWYVAVEGSSGPRTKVEPDSCRSIIATNESPDVGFDRSINTYLGCEHGCVYCYARPSHSYWGLSPGQDFESRIFAKPHAANLLLRELSRPGYICKMIALGTNTDPYQPIERITKITRSVLEVLSEFNHPVSITTKSASVTRDLNLLANMARRKLVKVFLSVTTLNRRLASKLEPRAATPERRLSAVRELSEAGIPTGVLVAPVIPGLTDTEIESVLAASARAGARECGYVILRLPHEVKDLVAEWLAIHEPYKASRVMALVREVHGGRTSNSSFGMRQRGSGSYAQMISDRYAGAVRRLGLNIERSTLDGSRFRVPNDQGELF